MGDPLVELRNLARQGTDPEEAADKVLASLSTKQVREIARPLLVWEATRAQRIHTRSIERKVAAAPDKQTRSDARRELIDRGFWLPDGRYVDWLKASADEHLERAEWLRGRAGAFVQTAVSHEEAAAEIREAGVSCLADLISGAA